MARESSRTRAARAIRHVRRLVGVGHCGEAAAYMRDNPNFFKVRSKTFWRLQKSVSACKPWIPPSLRR
jgi:hypothetical protein